MDEIVAAVQDAVDDYRELGLVPFPICRPLGKGCMQHGNCSKPGKVPLAPEWQKIRNHPKHQESVDRLLAKHAYQVNLGLLCGVAGDLIVLDIDGHEGKEALEGKELGTGPLVRTGRIGGWHHWYRASGLVVPRKIGLMPHVDLLAEASFVLAPPSLHASGNLYEHVGEGLWKAEWPTLPEWLERLAQHARATNPLALPAIDSDVGIGQRTREFLVNGVNSAQRETLVHAVTNLLGRGMPADECFSRVWFAISELSPTNNASDPWKQEQVRQIVDELDRKGVRPASALSSPSFIDDVRDSEPTTSEPVSRGPEPLVQSLKQWRESHEQDDSVPLIDGLLMQGRTYWLWGAPGTGKTLWALDLAFSIASGRAYHGRNTKKSPVLLIERDASNQLHDYMDLVESSGGYDPDELNKNFYVSESPTLHCKDRTGVHACLSLVDTIPDLKFVIVDAFTAVANMAASAADKSTHVRELKEGLEKRGITMLMIDHSVNQASKKDANGQAREPLETLYDGTMKQAVFDFGWYLRGNLREDHLEMVWAKLRGARKDPLKITFNDSEGFLVELNIPAGERLANLSDSEKKLARLVSERGKLDSEQVQVALNWSRQNLARVMRGVLVDRDIVRTQEGVGRGNKTIYFLGAGWQEPKATTGPRLVD